jgi:hypothetical protein
MTAAGNRGRAGPGADRRQARPGGPQQVAQGGNYPVPVRRASPWLPAGPLRPARAVLPVARGGVGKAGGEPAAEASEVDAAHNDHDGRPCQARTSPATDHIGGHFALTAAQR